MRKEIIESQRARNHQTTHEPLQNDVVYDDDYTESTASIGSSSVSASVESIEQFINSVRLAPNTTNTTNANTTGVKSDELETYHPRMEMRALSPYRTPEPGQAAVILNKPVPLPDPDIKPKSILKRRTSNESSGNELTTNSTALANEEKAFSSPSSPSPPTPPTPPSPPSSPPPPLSSPTPPVTPPTERQAQAKPQTQFQPHSVQAKSQPSTIPAKPTPPKREKEKRGFLNLFSKKTTSTENLKNRPAEPPVANVDNKPIKAAETGLEKQREKLKKRQDSVEENKVEQVAVIDHYSDIVREMSSRDNSRPPSRTSSYVPLYMNSHVMREAAARADEEEREFAKQQYERSRKNSSNELNKLNINEDEDAQFMLEVAKKMNLYTESNECDSMALEEQEMETGTKSLSLEPQNDLVEISVEHTQSVSYAVRTLPKVKSAARPFDRKTSISEQQRRSKSISPIGGQRKTSLSQTVLKVTRMPIEITNNDIDIDLPQSKSRSPSPESRCKTPEQIQIESDVETNSKSMLSFTINMILFVAACWLYVFYDARYAVPFLAVMVCGYVRDIIVNKWHKWTKRKTD